MERERQAEVVPGDGTMKEQDLSTTFGPGMPHSPEEASSSWWQEERAEASATALTERILKRDIPTPLGPAEHPPGTNGFIKEIPKDIAPVAVAPVPVKPAPVDADVESVETTAADESAIASTVVWRGDELPDPQRLDAIAQLVGEAVVVTPNAAGERVAHIAFGNCPDVVRKLTIVEGNGTATLEAWDVAFGARTQCYPFEQMIFSRRREQAFITLEATRDGWHRSVTLGSDGRLSETVVPDDEVPLAGELEAEGVVFARIPEDYYPGRRYITPRSLVDHGMTSFTQRHLFRFLREAKVPVDHLAEKMVLDVRAVKRVKDFEKQSKAKAERRGGRGPGWRAKEVPANPASFPQD